MNSTQPSSMYYYADTRRIEFRQVLKEGERMTPEEKAQMESFGCYGFRINRWIVENGTILDELCYSIDRDILEEGMNQDDKDRIETGIQNSLNGTVEQDNEIPEAILNVQLIETIHW